jgi:hypothetical protein
MAEIYFKDSATNENNVFTYDPDTGKFRYKEGTGATLKK